MPTPLSFVPDGNHILIQRSDGEPPRRVPSSMALRLFLGTQNPPRNEREPVVALSFAVTDGMPPSFVWLSQTEDGPVVWPSWAGEPPPAVAIRCAQWYPLPDVQQGCDAAQAVLQQVERKVRLAEERTAKDMDERCQSIVAHGEADDLCTSLDYYTTFRVKTAFQQMNAHTLRERLDTVCRREEEVAAVLRGCPHTLHEGFQTPPPPPDANLETAEDPNALCIPLPTDFDL